MGDELYVEGMDDAFLEWRAQHGQEWARYYGLTVSQPLPGLQSFHSMDSMIIQAPCSVTAIPVPWRSIRRVVCLTRQDTECMKCAVALSSSLRVAWNQHDNVETLHGIRVSQLPPTDTNASARKQGGYLCAGAAEQQSAGGLHDGAHPQHAPSASAGRAAAQQGGPPQHSPQVDLSQHLIPMFLSLHPALLFSSICSGLDQAACKYRSEERTVRPTA